jgi:BON domain-containing protein
MSMRRRSSGRRKSDTGAFVYPRACAAMRRTSGLTEYPPGNRYHRQENDLEGVTMKRLSAIWAGIGAGLMFFFDPQQGNRRRKMLADRTAGFFRRGARSAQQAGRGVAAEAYGVTQKVKHAREEEKDLDDVTLARKVETEIFRDAEAPKGQVDVNVVEGVVYLRGEVEEDMIKDLEKAARKVAGVKGVENLLHKPGTAAPTAPEGSSSSS